MEQMKEFRTVELAPIQPINDELFTRWINYVDASPKTVETYTRAIRQFSLYLAENGITQPTREDVIAYREALKENHKAATVQAYLIAVKQFFSWTAQEGIFPNISDNVKGCKITTEHKKDYLTAAQIKNILAGIDRSTLKGLRDFAIVSLMVTSGMREIEIVRADVGDIRTVADFTALFLQGKGHSEKDRFVKLAPPVEDAIRKYLTARGSQPSSAPLFASVSNRGNGERMTTKSISRLVKEKLVNAGYDSDRLTAHSLRHSAATLNLLNGGTIFETQQMLSHSNINTTMIYTHALDRANNRSEERIASVIFNDTQF